MKASRGKSGSGARAVGTIALRARLERTEERLRAVEERHRFAMEAIRESVYDYDVLRDSIYYSDSMQRELGLPPGTLRTPQDWRDRIHPDDVARYHQAFVAHLKGATERFVCDYRYRGGDGTWRWARQHGLAVRDRNGRALRVVGSTGDITDLKRAEEALEHVRGRYDLALRAINEGVYEWDIAAGTAYYSERLYEVLKLAPGDLEGPMDWRKRIHPEDLPDYDAGLVAHFKGQTERFECEYRYKARDGSWRWARQHGLAVRDASGRAVRMTGSTGDITDLKQAQEALRTSEERYARATEAAVEGIYEWDIAAGRLFLTERAKEFFSLSGEELTPAAWNVRVHAEDYPRYRAAIVEHFKGRTPQLEIEYRITAASGGYRWVLDRGKAVRNGQGRAVKMVGALSDITERKRAELELRRARDEATESLEQQTATANVLRVISGSLTDLAPVFDTILDNAVRLCEGNAAVLWRFDGEVLRFAAHKNGSAKGVAYLQERPLALGDYNPTPQAGLERRTIHVLDVFAEARYRPLVPPDTHRTLPNSGTVLAVPLLKDERLLGVITIWRFEKRMFTDKQVAMVNTFAAQAVIAIENVRLFNETKEALERQTATADILKVIAGSPSDVQPVFDTIVRSAVRLCGALFGAVYRFDGEKLHFVAHHNFPRTALQLLERTHPRPPDRSQGAGRAILTKSVVRIGDVLQDADYRRAYAEGGGWRRVLAVPMMRSGTPLGTISVAWADPGPIPDGQVSLLKTFADQAAIAIENARLFNETKDALERQTATADILKVISSSPTDVQPVLEAVAERAAILCGAQHLSVWLMHGQALRRMAICGSHGGIGDEVPIRPTMVNGRAVLERRIVHIEDILPLLDSEYPDARENVRRLGVRSMLVVPLLREGSAIGTISAWRTEVKAFSKEEISLLQTFADQAVIAIENARLFNETREALERQTATAEILKVMASSPSDVQPVFEAIIRSASRLSGGCSVNLSRVVGNELHLAAYTPVNPEADEILRSAYPVHVDETARPLAEAVHRKSPFFVSDFETEQHVGRKAREVMRARGFRSTLYVPLVRGDVVHGVMHVSKVEPGPFPDQWIELLKTFADQAVIAIENVRLFNETKEALEQQTATAEILKVISGSPTDVQPVFEAIVRSAAQLFPPCKAVIVMREGERLQWKARAEGSQSRSDLEELAQLYPLPFDPQRSVSAQAIVERKVIHIPDTEAHGVAEAARLIGRAAKHRSVTVVPLLREGEGIGTIGIQHPQAGFALSENQLGLLRTFADQAVIAIENVRLFNETREALEQQTATAEILKVMSGSLTDIQPVVDVVAATAARLCEANDVLIQMRDGDLMRSTAHHGSIPVAPTRPISPKLLLGRVVDEGRQIQVDDIQTEDEQYPDSAESARRQGFHTILHTPLIRAGHVIGIITMRRMEVKPFNEKQKALVKTFADQAVIAIENVRLFNETKEALDQQRASAEVLRVISGSVADTKPVFDAILESCERLFEGQNVGINLVGDDGLVHVAAYRGPGREAFEKHMPVPLSMESGSGAAILQRCVLHYADLEHGADVPAYLRRGAALQGNKAMIVAPMMWKGEGIGVVFVGRGMARAFTDKEVSLLKTFADQAVIAIQNARLFNETREALEQQTATAEILKVMSGSLTDIQPVVDVVAATAARLCQADDVLVNLRDGDVLRSAAHHGTIPVLPARPLSPKLLAGRVVREGRQIQVDDLQKEDEQYPESAESARQRGFHTILHTPLMRASEVIGIITMRRAEVKPFNEKQKALVKTFADQAVIAIENVRLFNETKEALERQTATSEVLKVISQTRIDLEPVLDIVLKNARRLCGADQAVIFRADDHGNCVPASLQVAERANEIMEFYREHPIRPNRGSATGRAMLEGRAIHIPDVLADSEYRMEYATNRNYRSILAVPMLREGSPIGVLTVTRVGEPRPFTEKQIELVTSFADQAVIAIENVRLFNETTEALEQQKASAEILRVISASIADTKPVFDAILESCERLFQGKLVGINLVGDDGLIRNVAYHGPGVEELENVFPLQVDRHSGSGSAIVERRVMHYPDLENGADVPEGARRGGKATGIKAEIFAPMMWEGRGQGVIFVGREYAGPFSEKEIALLKIFADQAVIAIQNARLFREINEKSRQVEIANKHKSEFLANMSHELRTPLNAIIGFTRIVMRRAKEQLEPKQYENLEKIHSSGQHLLQLINAILDLSKVEAGRVEVNAADVALGPVLEQCVKTVEPLVKAPAVRLLKDFDGGLPQVHVDEEKLRQIVINLLSNAVKFTERGTVRVRAECKGDGFSVAVADTGIGIPGEKLEHVFEEFAQADASSTRVYGGTGLGLTIARRLARLMGGDISAQSEPGVGSTFTLTLPVRYQALAQVRPGAPAQARA